MKKLKKLIYELARKFVANRLKDGTQLTTKYLEDHGWRYRDGYFVEPLVKDRDRVSIKFQNSPNVKGHYYQVFHSEKRTFIALEISIEWLELHLLCMDKHRPVDNLIGNQ
jgi:hypothetical protein